MKKTLSQILHTLRVRGKPLCIHCEVQHIPEFQRRLKKFLSILPYKPILYCITPTNKEYIQGLFGNSENDFEEQLKTSYLNLKKRGYPLELHVHLRKISNLLSFHQKKDIIQDALMWMRTSGFNVSELALGWNKQENGMEKIASDLGLKLMAKNCYRVIHDFEL